MQSSVAKATLIIFVSGLMASFIVKYINKSLGRYVRYIVCTACYIFSAQVTYFLGLCLLWAAM